MSLISQRVGSRQLFAIEFEMKPDHALPPNEWLGSIWLWVDGRCVGESHEIEMVSIGLGALSHAAKAKRSRISSLFASLPPEQALDAVMLAIYGDDDQKAKGAVSPDDLDGLDILPSSAGPFFDHWQAILIEDGPEERFIYRRTGGQIFEARWKINTFRDTVLEAEVQFRKVAKSWVV